MRVLTSVVVGSSLVVAAGCGKSAVGPVDGADAASVSAGLGSSAESQAGGFGPQGSGAPFLAATGCPGGGSVSVTPTPLVDSDGDGVPDNATVTWANCMVSGSGGTATYNGTIQISDPTPNVADYDLNMAISLTAQYVTTNASATQVITGSRSASSPAGSFTQADSLDVSTDLTFSGQSHHVDESHSWSATYTPGSAWTPGQPLVAGGMQIQGSASFTVDSHSSDMSISSSGLAIDPACPTYIVAGTLDAAWSENGHNATVTVTWTGCGVRSGTFQQS